MTTTSLNITANMHSKKTEKPTLANNTDDIFNQKCCYTNVKNKTVAMIRDTMLYWYTGDQHA